MERILQHSCNGISATPQFILSIKENGAEPLTKRIGTQIHFVEFGATLITIAEKKQMLDTFPAAHIYLQYGLTEVPAARIWKSIMTEEKPSPWVTPHHTRTFLSLMTAAIG